MSESRANLVLHSPHMLTSTAHVSDCHFIDDVSCLSVWQKLTAFPTKAPKSLIHIENEFVFNKGDGVFIGTVIIIYIQYIDF